MVIVNCFAKFFPLAAISSRNRAGTGTGLHGEFQDRWHWTTVSVLSWAGLPLPRLTVGQNPLQSMPKREPPAPSEQQTSPVGLLSITERQLESPEPTHTCREQCTTDSPNLIAVEPAASLSLRIITQEMSKEFQYPWAFERPDCAGTWKAFSLGLGCLAATCPHPCSESLPHK